MSAVDRFTKFEVKFHVTEVAPYSATYVATKLYGDTDPKTVP